MLVRQGAQRFHGDLRRAAVAATGFDHGLEKQRARDRCGMPELIRATGRLLDKPARAVELAQVPLRQREEVRGADPGVIAEAEQRIPVALLDIFAKSTFESLLRFLQVA